MPGPTRVGCFSYLAAVHTLHVAQYPAINYGVDVLREDRFLAGDGPLVAGCLKALGHEANLVTNAVGNDSDGRHVLDHLDRWGVAATCDFSPDVSTPVNVVVCDDAGNRTWFSGLRGIGAKLAALDPGTLIEAPIVYADCYEVLGDAARTMITAALNAGSDAHVNLGGSPPPTWFAGLMPERIKVLQTNASENHDAALAALTELSQLGVAELIVVTAGRLGAIARRGDGPVVSSAAPTVRVRQVQGAGAVFSAAFIHARNEGATLQACLDFAAAAGSLWCARTHDDALPTTSDINAMRRR